MLAVSTATHPSLGAAILSIAFVLYVLRVCFRAMFGRYEYPPHNVRRGRRY